jgi:hypothetical protein
MKPTVMAGLLVLVTAAGGQAQTIARRVGQVRDGPPELRDPTGSLRQRAQHQRRPVHRRVGK